LEVANTDELLRTAAAAAFESWLEVLEQRFTEAGMSTERSLEVAVEAFCLIEGALLLARTTRSSVAMHIAGRAAARAVSDALADSRS
jgi:hypothetical protein